MSHDTLADLTARIADPAAPLITYYDLDTGERVELSAVTTANWVAKTSNFLIDEADADHQTRIRIGLPTHWLRFVWLLAAWQVGATVTDVAADIGVSGPDLVADEPLRLASALLPFGVRFAEAPDGFIDLGAEIPGHGDHFMALDPPLPVTGAVELDGKSLDHRQMLEQAEPNSGRVLVGPADLITDAEHIVAACVGNGSLVIVVGGDHDDIDRIAEQERARPKAS